MSLLPRLLPTAFVRGHLDAWLQDDIQLPLRVIIAPSGCGKTTSLVQYARTHPAVTVYISFHGPTNEEQLLRRISEALGFDQLSYRAIVTKLEERRTCTIIFDGVEVLDTSASNCLERLASEIPAGVRLVVAGIRTHMDVSRYVLRGFANMMPPELLYFTASELQQLATGLQLEMSDEYAEDLRARTDGWPIVVSDVLRLAKLENIDAFEAYDRWLMTRGDAFLQIMQEEITHLAAAARENFDLLVNGGALTLGQTQSLLREGAPIIRDLDSVRLLRVLSDLLPRTITPYQELREPLRVRMFGRFAICFREHEVQWIRRRDQQVVRYLLLRPDCRVTKAELLVEFWPDSEASLATQSLRTACSNIRKALSAVMGRELADEFFRVEANELRIQHERAVIDTYRFFSHIEAAEHAHSRHDSYTALAHAAAAVRLYRADLFAGEPLEAWFARDREKCKDACQAMLSLRTMLRNELRIQNSSAWNEDVHSEARDTLSFPGSSGLR